MRAALPQGKISLPRRRSSPLKFCMHNMAGDRNILTRITQRKKKHLDVETNVEMRISYTQLRLHVAKDAVGQSIVTELPLRLFVLHWQGDELHCIAQPQGPDNVHRNGKAMA